MLPPHPTAQDIFQVRLFEEPLVPMGAEPTPDENAALATAIQGYSQRCSPDAFSSLTDFFEAYPESPWNAALLINLGSEYYRSGYYSKALEAWHQAWELAKDVTELRGKALADRASGELTYMLARVGRMAELEALLKSIEGRALCGPATEKIAGSREGLVNMQARPEICFRCGSLALHHIKLAVHPDDPQTELIDATESPPQGFSLHQVAELSQRLSLDLQMAFRDRAAEFVIPSVVHFKLDHFAAIIRCEGDRYLLQDPTFQHDAWVTREALEAEASGYFLVPPGELPEDWRSVEGTEAKRCGGKETYPTLLTLRGRATQVLTHAIPVQMEVEVGMGVAVAEWPQPESIS